MDNKSSLPWGISNEKLQPSSLGQITDSKLATFAAGQQKKSRFQKAREGIRYYSQIIAAIVYQQLLTIVRAVGAIFQRRLLILYYSFNISVATHNDDLDDCHNESKQYILNDAVGATLTRT